MRSGGAEDAEHRFGEYPIHQSIVTFDIEGFAEAHRDDRTRIVVRDCFYDLLRVTFAAAGIPWQLCRHEDRGDGAIVLVPSRVPKVLLLDPLIACLTAALADHNRTTPVGERFRLRCAMHAGEVLADGHGLSGADLVTACRMLDADELRAVLRRSDNDLAVMVSDVIYDGTVRHRYRNLDPIDYHPVSLEVKKNRIHAWIYLPTVAVNEPAGDVNRPHQLPPPVSRLIGRERELAALDQWSDGLAVLVGPPGVGKSALALHWAHQVGAGRLDGKLYADLGGPGHVESPARVLRRFLRSLAVPARDMPSDTSELVFLFRRLTAKRRLLVVLDNAESASDIRSILPSSTCVTVVTGPSRLGSLSADGAEIFAVSPLSRNDGIELLAQCVGEGRVAAEIDFAAQLVKLCGGLPLALRIAGARLAIRPRWTVERAVADLADERHRLARLSFGDELSVRAAFDAAYQALSPSAARLYRILGQHPARTFDVRTAAAVAGSSSVGVERPLEELLNANLLDEPRAGRYRFNDLVRLHASQCTEDMATDDGANGAQRSRPKRHDDALPMARSSRWSMKPRPSRS